MRSRWVPLNVQNRSVLSVVRCPLSLHGCRELNGIERFQEGEAGLMKLDRLFSPIFCYADGECLATPAK